MSLQLIMLLICKTLAAPTGEMLRPLAAPQSFFETEREKLRGMNETIEKINVKKEYQGYQQEIKQRVYEIANVAQVPSTEEGMYVHMNILQLWCGFTGPAIMKISAYISYSYFRRNCTT